MHGKDSPNVELVSIAQRVQSLAYVLTLNPYHSAALVALREKVQAAVQSPTVQGDAGLLGPLQELDAMLAASVDHGNVQMLGQYANQLFAAVVSRLAGDESQVNERV